MGLVTSDLGILLPGTQVLVIMKDERDEDRPYHPIGQINGRSLQVTHVNISRPLGGSPEVHYKVGTSPDVNVFNVEADKVETDPAEAIRRAIKLNQARAAKAMETATKIFGGWVPETEGE